MDSLIFFSFFWKTRFLAMLYVVHVCIMTKLAGYEYIWFMEQFYNSGKSFITYEIMVYILQWSTYFDSLMFDSLQMIKVSNGEGCW